MTVGEHARELARPRIHLSPLHGWMNDPNGLVVDASGHLHVFFQYEPDAPAWGRMRWGHAVSTDMLTWQHGPIALEPGAAGSPDHFGCWSGSIVTSEDGTATAFFTGVAGDDGDRMASVCAATSDAGLTIWTKDAEPVIAGPPDGIRRDAFRDPFVWRDGPDWSMLVGAGSDDEQGSILLYRSPDLRAWTYVGPFLTAQDVLGRADLPAADVDSPCWECPQLLRFGDLDLLIVSIVDRAPTVRPAHVVAFVGRMTGDRSSSSTPNDWASGPTSTHPPPPDWPMAATCCSAGSRKTRPRRDRNARGLDR